MAGQWAWDGRYLFTTFVMRNNQFISVFTGTIGRGNVHEGKGIVGGANCRAESQVLRCFCRVLSTLMPSFFS